MRFTTKDSGKREEYNSGMVRDVQEGKPDFTYLLIPGVAYKDQPIIRLIELYMRGAEKYGRYNWTKADSEEELQRFKQSGLRHHMQYLCGETDEDHQAAVLFNIIATMYVEDKLGQ